MNTWISAAASLVGGLIIGSMAGRTVRKQLSRPSRSDALKQIAPAAGSFVFGVCAAGGLLVAASFADPEGLKTVPRDMMGYFPKLLIAGLIVLVGNVAATLAGLALERALVRASGEPRPGPVRMLKMGITVLCAILAVGQLGVNTTIVNIALAALLFSLGATVAMLVGIGGLDVARSVAAGRYIRRIVPVGSDVDTGLVGGIVVAVHPATIEVRQADGSSVHVPHSHLMTGSLRVRAAASTPQG